MDGLKREAVDVCRQEPLEYPHFVVHAELIEVFAQRVAVPPEQVPEEPAVYLRQRKPVLEESQEQVFFLQEQVNDNPKRIFPTEPLDEQVTHHKVYPLRVAKPGKVQAQLLEGFLEVHLLLLLLKLLDVREGPVHILLYVVKTPVPGCGIDERVLLVQILV